MTLENPEKPWNLAGNPVPCTDILIIVIVVAWTFINDSQDPPGAPMMFYGLLYPILIIMF